MNVQHPLVDRLVVGFDVEKYSPRNVRRQSDTQSDLVRLLNEAASAAGLDRSEWETQSGGDGELAVLPASTDLARVASRFVSELDDRLSTYNEDRVPEMRIRLRVAMHMDVLIRSELGQAGPALVVLSRLLDDPALRAALREAPGASLALLVSGSLFQKVIMSGLSGLRPEEFRQIQIDNPAKDFRMAAFLRVPRFSPPRFGAAAPGPTATAPTTDSGGPSTPSPDSPTRTQAPVQSMSIGGVHIGGNVSNFTGDIVGGAKNA
jgi:hypothetical protein